MKKLAYAVLLACASTGAYADECRGNCAPNNPPSVTPNVTITPNITPSIAPVISPDIRNTNLNAQDQRQAQGQLQGQSQTATGGNASSSAGAIAGSISHAAGGNQWQTSTSQGGAGGSATSTSAGGAGGSATSTSAGGDASNNGVTQGVQVNNISTAPADVRLRTVGQAPDMVANPTAPCRTAVGVSGGWLGGALGFGTSIEDEGCTLRENARMLYNFGEKAAALKLMCNDAKVAAVLPACAPSPQPQ